MGILKLALIATRLTRFITKRILPSSLLSKAALVALILIFIFMIIKYLISKRIKIYYKPTKLNTSTLEFLKSRLKKCKPTFYLPLPMLKMVTLTKSKQLKNKAIYVRESIKLRDGEVIGLDIHPKNHKEFDKNHPTIIFVPGLNGTSTNKHSSYICEMCEKDHSETKFRVGILNKRGFGGMPILGKRLTNMDIYEDLIDVVKHVSKEFQTKNIYLIGFSLGSIHTLKALQSGRMDGLVKAASLIGNPWKWKGVLAKLRKMPFIDNKLTRKHISLLADHLHEPHFLRLMKEKEITEGNVF